jgi:uncharacterized membrane protein YciS (DUF1049 family)
MQLRLILWLALLAVFALFVAQNAQVVEVRFLIWRFAMSQAVLLFFVLAAGFGAGWIMHAWIAWRRVRGPARSDDIDLHAGG